MGLDPGGNDQVYGAAVKAPLFGEKGLTLHLSAVTGELQGDAGFNTGTTDTAARGDTVGLKLTGNLLGITVDGEVAGSWFDADTSTGPGKVSDRAYELSLARDVLIGDLSLHLLRYGSDFASIANPSFTGDREAVEATLASKLGLASLSLNGSYTEDNVDHDPDRPVVTSTHAGATVDLSPAGWPSLNLGYNLGIQDSRDEPAGSNGVQNLQHDISLGMAYARGIWNASFTASTGLLDDRLATDRDSETRNLVLAGGIHGKRLSIAPSLSYNETEGDGVTHRSQLASLTLSLPLWPDLVDLSGQGSYQKGDASDDSTDSRTTNGSVRISWNLQPLLQRVHLGWANVELAFTADYNRVEDRRDPANDQEEYATLVTLNLGAPYRFGWGWEMGW